MRYLIISDIHGNLNAFEAVLADAAGDWDRIWCLGDVVGYGPQPNECVALLRQHDHLSLSGNHDWAVLGKLDISNFNDEARLAIDWTRDTLAEVHLRYLDGLPPITVEPPFTLAHASPRQPVWEYIVDPWTAAANFEHFDTPYCLVGHSHVPIYFERVGQGQIAIHEPLYDQPLALGENRLIINPGSVGQPRDLDPRAAYALLDLETLTLEHRRVVYPVEETQKLMMEQGMPYRLIARLSHGW